MRFDPIGMMLLPLLIAPSIACRSEGVCEELSELPEGRSFDEGASLEGCPGHPDHRDFVTACEGVFPRVVVTVRDERGLPVPNALVYPFPQVLSKQKIDPIRFPEVSGTEQTIGYDACTNEQGIAVLCGFDPVKLPTTITQVRAVKRGYGFSHTGELTVLSISETSTTVVLAATEAADHRILVMSCEPHHREPTLLERQNIDFVMAPIGTVIEQLPSFDVLLVGFACNKYESFNELLTRDGNAELLNWVENGGLLFFAQQNDAQWSRETGCSCQAKACPEQILPPQYRFKILSENDKCNDYEAASVVEGDHPLVRGVSAWEGWRWKEQIAPAERRRSVCLDCIDGTSVGDMWNVVLRAEAIPDESKPKSNCPTWSGGDYDLASTHVALMYASYGQGTILVAQHAWEQGSEGDSVPEFPNTEDWPVVDQNAVAARDAVIDFLTGRR